MSHTIDPSSVADRVAELTEKAEGLEAWCARLLEESAALDAAGDKAAAGQKRWLAWNGSRRAHTLRRAIADLPAGHHEYLHTISLDDGPYDECTCGHRSPSPRFTR